MTGMVKTCWEEAYPKIASEKTDTEVCPRLSGAVGFWPTCSAPTGMTCVAFPAFAPTMASGRSPGRMGSLFRFGIRTGSYRGLKSGSTKRTIPTGSTAGSPAEMNMNNNYTIAQRNALVEKYLWCIDTVIRKNRPLMRAARLEYDDVYQQLALRLIRAVAGFDPQKGTLQQHIFAQLKYELLNCKSAYRLCGLTGAPKEYRKSDMVSLDHISEGSSLYEQVMAA